MWHNYTPGEATPNAAKVSIIMSIRTKKIIIAAAGILIVLLSALAVVAPRLINTAAIRNAIVKEASERIGGRVEVGGIDVSILPLPHAVLHSVSVSIPGTLSATSDSLEVQPRIGGLLTGKLQIGRIVVVRPDIKVVVRRKADTPAITEEKIRSLLSSVAAVFPGGSLRVEKGVVELSTGDDSPLSFTDVDIDVQFPSDAITLAVSCRSAFAEHVSLSGSVRPENLKGDWRVQARDLKPHILAPRLYPAAETHIGESSVTMEVRVKHEGFRIFDAEFDGSAPSLTLLRGGAQHVLAVNKLAGVIHHSEEKTELAISTLALASPSLLLSSTFTIDRQTPHAVLEIEGRDVDAAALRKTALALAGDIPLVQTIFSYVHTGTIPSITFRTDGRGVSDLGATRNIVIKGQMRDGTVGIPSQGLVVARVNGDVLISDGILKGTNLSAHMWQADAREGVLRVGLKGEDAPFHLDVHVDAQLSELPSLLKRFIRNPSVVEELSRVGTIEGKARGRLVLGDSLTHIFVRHDIASLQFSASYGRIPYAVKVSGGRFFFDEKSSLIKVADLSGSIGGSTFTDVSADLEMRDDVPFTLRSMKSSLHLGELYAWLTSYESLRKRLAMLTGLKGSIDVTALTFDGKISEMNTWRFLGGGEIKGVQVQGKDLPGPLDVKGGAFTASRERLSVTNSRVQALDASLDVTGSLKGYLDGSPGVEVTLAGRLGPDATRYVSEKVSPRPGISLKGPVQLSDVRLGWSREEKSSVAGRFVFDTGPVVVLDLVLDKGKVSIPALEISDGGTKAFFFYRPGERKFDLRFAGELNEVTIGKIITGLEAPACCLRGDLEARIDLDHPPRSTAQGTIEVKNIRVPSLTKGPLTVNTLSLNAEGNTLTVNDALLSWSDGNASLRGSAALTERAILLDMDLTAQRLQIERLAELGKSFRAEETSTTSWSPVIEGKVRVKADALAYRDFTWQPFQAEVSFDDDHLDVAVTGARLCGIATPGNIKIAGDVIEFSAALAASGENVRSTFQCLTDNRDDLIGTYSLKATLRAKGTVDSLLRSLSGNVEFSAKKGLIYRNPMLSNIFALLNVSEIFRGKFPSFGQKGLRYKSATVRGEIKDGRFLVEEMVIDGPTVQIAGQGEVDLVGRSFDFTALVAPFKTVDWVVSHIPIVGHVLGGTLVAVPVKVSGGLDDPKVTVMAPSAVGTQLMGITKRTLGLPFKFIEPFLPRKPEEEFRRN